MNNQPATIQINTETEILNNLVADTTKKKEALILNRINDLGLLNAYFEALIKRQSERLFCIKEDTTDYYFFAEHRTPVFLISFEHKTVHKICEATNQYIITTGYHCETKFVPQYILDNLKEML